MSRRRALNADNTLFLEDIGGDAFHDWELQTHAMGGRATTWPFDDQFRGAAAAAFDRDNYVDLFNRGAIDPRAPQRSNSASTTFYVLAPEAVQQDAPQVVSVLQRIVNRGFLHWDEAVDAFWQGMATGQALVPGGSAPTVPKLPGLPGWVLPLLVVAGGVALASAIRRT